MLGREEIPASEPTSDEKLLAILSHILCIVVGLGFIPPLIIYILKKDESYYIAENAKESLNFQLTMLLLCIVFFISVIGILFIWFLGIFNLVLVIVATIKTSENKIYRYPINLRLIK